MGICASSEEGQINVPPEQKNLNRNINAKLLNEARIDKNKVKLLLLGPGESGKSTIFKQMKLIYGNQYTVLERKQQLPTIHSNIMEGIKLLTTYMQIFGYREYLQSVDSFNLIESLDVYEGISPATGDAICKLWKDPAIQMTWARRNEFQITESVKYYFDKMEIMKLPNYIPDVDDMLYCRFRTSGIVTEKYLIDGTTFEMYDVGGQRNERRKWIHCFENVTGVIFVAGLSDFNQTVYEDNSMNRMVEAINLFEYICNNMYFSKSSIILFLNKRDLFLEKIKTSNIVDYFPDYTGPPNNYDEGVKFFLGKFAQRNVSGSAHQIYHHITCATDTRNVHAVFSACKDIILRDNLKSSGIIMQ